MKKIFYGWWVVLASFFIAFYVGGAVMYGFTAFFNPIADEFGWSYTEISIAASLRGLEMGIFAPIVGSLVDRFGPRKLAFCGTLTIGFGLILLSRTDSLPMFYGSFILIALGASTCTSTVLMTAVVNWFKRNAGKALGIMACGFGASGLLVPVIVRLIDLYQWQTALIILGFGMWALGIPLSFLLRHRPEQYGYLPDGEILAEPAPDFKRRDMEVSLKKVLKNSDFWRITIADTIRVMVLTAVVTHVMPYLSNKGMSRSSAALVATLIPLLSIIGRLGFGWLGDRFDKRYVTAGTLCLMGLGLLAFSYIQPTWFIFLFLIMFSPAYGGGVTLRGAIVREYFGKASFGMILGLMMGISFIGGVIGPSVAGWTFDTLGSYRMIWLAFAGAMGISVTLIATIKPRLETMV